ncbi:hypothetical protein S40285_10820 [Stachybotrys chlorohalonatus IBT 40285]|uniref:F-box domain-containing protein n=1 Tax=Stachybotrys chlorohalonatus (strain IBT 40285) TaxID=1283841 RepID=A0A084QNH1_STAC4|nr:hypothetical protein S40285_10820 [Stachybotrys chlorohalonata IBT 40285]
MQRITALPVEILQMIGAFLDIRSKVRFLQSHRNARRAFYNDRAEQVEIWDLIIKDRKWFNKMSSQGIKIALVGSDLRFIKETDEPEWDNLIVALIVLFWPKGKRLYDVITPESLPARYRDRKRFWKENPELYSKYMFDRCQIRGQAIEGLLGALCSSNFDERCSEVKFRGFNVHVGAGIRNANLEDMARLLLPHEDRTLVLYYNGGPSPLHHAEVEFPYGSDWFLQIKDDRCLIASFMDSSRIR